METIPLTDTYPITDFFRGMYDVETNHESIYSDIYSIKFSGSECVSIKNTKHNLYIDHLEKCGPFSTSDILDDIVLFAKANKKHEIMLKDDSELKLEVNEKVFKVSLAFLNILSTGISLYNSRGFVSEKFSEEKIKNKKFIELKFIEAVSTTSFSKKGDKYYKTLEKILNKKEENIQSMTVQEVFTEVAEYLQNKLPDKIIVQDINSLILNFRKMLVYDFNLRMDLRPVSFLKNIERLVVYVTPNTTDRATIELKNFILSQSNQKITLNKGININVPIVETNLSPVVHKKKLSSRGSVPSSASVVNDNYLIQLHSDFCSNDDSEIQMNTVYTIPSEPDYIIICALTTDNGIEVPAFIITFTLYSDMSEKSDDLSLWIQALCSDQTKHFIGGSTMLRLVLYLSKIFNETAGSFQIVNSYLGALSSAEPTYLKLGYEPTTDFKSKDATALKINISKRQNVNANRVAVKKSKSSSDFANADINNLEQVNKLIDDFESGKITWVIDRIGDKRPPHSTSMAQKSIKVKGRKPNNEERRLKVSFPLPSNRIGRTKKSVKKSTGHTKRKLSTKK